jgi:hypothetical protein
VQLALHLARLLQAGSDAKHIIQAGGQVVAQACLGHHEHATLLFLEGVLVQAQAAQPLGARPLEKLQVVGIEHNAACICVFPVHPHGKHKIRSRVFILHKRKSRF